MPVVFENVRVPAANMLLGEGRGFEIAQGRLGPGPHPLLHAADRARREGTRTDVRRTASRVAFGKRRDAGADRQGAHHDRADAAADLEGRVDHGHQRQQGGTRRDRDDQGRRPNMACRVIDWAIQAFGGAGVTGDYGLAHAYATARVLRLADGPDEVHRNQIARLELRK